MFAVAIPDLPPQYAAVAVVQQSAAKQRRAKTDPTIGVCHLIENPPQPPGSAVNIIDPLVEVGSYLDRHERFTRDQLTADVYYAANVSVLRGPKHGRLEEMPREDRRTGGGGYYYHPTAGYFGPDQAALLVEMAGRKVRVRYFFNVLPHVPDGTEGYDPHDDRNYCPQRKGRVWMISLAGGRRER